jgi:hypothetical protein
MIAEDLQAGWRLLQELSRGEYGVPLEQILVAEDKSLLFRRVGRLTAVWPKHPFAESFAYDPDLPSNWAKAERCWEIHEQPRLETIEAHRAQFNLLILFAAEWARPAEFVAEFNVFHSICKRLKPVVCGESKALENTEKIAKDLQKAGSDVMVFSPNQLLGAVSVTVAGYLVQALPWLSPHAPIVTGATLLALCLGQRHLCSLLKDFVDSYQPTKDAFANHLFPLCGSVQTGDRKPCGNRVRTEGLRCWIHALV